MKHPGPWTYDKDVWQIIDADGDVVVCDVGGNTSAVLIAIEQERAELLAELKRVEEYAGLDEASRALIARIEGK